MDKVLNRPVEAFKQPEPTEPKLPKVVIGVDVTPDGTYVTAAYHRPDQVMEVFYSEFHPMPVPTQPVPKCRCCGTTENLHEDLGSGGPYRCSSPDCMVF